MTVYEQLKAYCDCFKDNEISDSDVDELIDLVSMATCWCLEPCETFLSSERTELIELPNCLDECDVLTFEPYFTPFEKDSFEFTLVEVQGIEETLIPITDYAYSEVSGVFRIDLPIGDCKCKPSCGCEAEYKLKVDYIAGYDEIPECLLPAFCEALQYVVERRKCDCEECQECINYDEQTEVLVDNAASITNQLKVYFVNLLSEQYKKQLALISLCNQYYSIWGTVV